ncbi:MAG TPA: hypothetical protein VHQ21_17850 [Rhodanobacteraceae bacterium]|jgi:hypothetical protein|nr:hypothetical protein [Rhodanobacteraceae bacterium]
MLLRRLIDRFRRQDWFSVGIELVVLILGIVLGLQATDWSSTRRDRADEQIYLERLLADNSANLAELQRAVETDEQRATKIRSITEALGDASAQPDPDALRVALCRWFVQPDIHLQRATYQELVSSGRLLLIQSQQLRELLAAEDAAHAESRRLDVLIPAIQHGAEPVEVYRRWHLDAADKHAGASCSFDIAGMRHDPRVDSALAQLYRGQELYMSFTKREIEAAGKTRAMLLEALGRSTIGSTGAKQ